MDIELEKAEQQLLGFCHAKQGYSLTDLIVNVGLTKEEYEQLKKNYDLSFLSSGDKLELIQHFKEEE